MNVTTNLLNDDDVLSATATSLMFQCTFKVSEFMTIVQSKISDEELLIDGIDCELLSPGKKWMKGKFRLRLEFSPDDSEVTAQPDSLGDSTGNTSEPNNNGALNTDDVPVEPSTPVYDNIPPSMYADGNANSVGMWS